MSCHNFGLHFPALVLHFCKMAVIFCYSVSSCAFLKSRYTAVPSPIQDSARILCPRRSQMRLHKYSPIPLAFFCSLPLQPVYPFSKILGKSSGAIPIPVSRTHKTPGSVSSIEMLPPALVYFRACLLYTSDAADEL